MGTIRYVGEAGVAEILLDRAERNNAFDADTIFALRDALVRADGDGRIRSILLAAEGANFCVGDDVHELAMTPPERGRIEQFVAALQDVTRSIMLGGKPVVIAVQGWIVGGAAAWALNADLVVVGESARLYLPEAAYGMSMSGGATLLLDAKLGTSLATSVGWMGRKLSADDLLSYGLAGEVVPDAGLRAHARKAARRLADLPAATRSSLKSGRVAQVRADLEKALDEEAAACVEAALSDEVRGRMAAAIGGGR